MNVLITNVLIIGTCFLSFPFPRIFVQFLGINFLDFCGEKNFLIPYLKMTDIFTAGRVRGEPIVRSAVALGKRVREEGACKEDDDYYDLFMVAGRVEFQKLRDKAKKAEEENGNLKKRINELEEEASMLRQRVKVAVEEKEAFKRNVDELQGQLDLKLENEALKREIDAAREVLRVSKENHSSLSVSFIARETIICFLNFANAFQVLKF